MSLLKQIIFSDEEPIIILDKSYITNIQMECAKTDVFSTAELMSAKNWSYFTISRGGNETEYMDYSLSSVVIDISNPCVLHFILDKTVENNVDPETAQYAEAARILMGVES